MNQYSPSPLRFIYPDEYKTWKEMRRRCRDRRSSNHKSYAARGIKVCKRWEGSFLNFIKDMGRKPGKEFSIERINNDGNYEPSNCKWATRREQATNQQKTIRVLWKGKKVSLAWLCSKLGRRRMLVYDRFIVWGMPLEKALKNVDYRFNKKKPVKSNAVAFRLK